MKKVYFLLVVLFFSACKKDEETSQTPVAVFSVNKSVVNEQFTIMALPNQSENTSSYLWDFGNGKTSTDKNPSFSYDNRGDYTVTLEAKNDQGEVAVSKKQIRVLGPVIKMIVIDKIDVTKAPNGSSIDGDKDADIWVEVKVKDRSEQDIFLSNGTIKRTLLYKTEEVKTIGSGNVPVVFKLKEPKSISGYVSNKDYSFELYARKRGKIYLLHSSDLIGKTFLTDANNNFRWYSGLWSGVEITGDYQ